MDKLKTLVTNSLLAFAFISIGFVLGKYSGRQAVSQVVTSVDNERYVAVYYMHTTRRCMTCNSIEKMTRKVLDSSYKIELAAGRLRWQEIDFQKQTQLARRFEVVASCVVVAHIRNGKIADFKRLDGAWTLRKHPAAFTKYISDAIEGYLGPCRELDAGEQS